jgi:hypothetical protein
MPCLAFAAMPFFVSSPRFSTWLGFCLLRTIKHFDSLYLTVMVLFGASLIADLLWTHRVRRLAENEIGKRRSLRRQYRVSVGQFGRRQIGRRVSI